MIGWTSLRAAMRSWGITTEQDLSQWLRRQGFPGPQPGNHISARAQEFVLAEGCRFDARVAMLEVVFVTTTLEFGRQTVPAREQQIETQTDVARNQGRAQRDPTIPNLDFFDDVDLEELFTDRVPMLKSCPHFFRGRLRNSFRVALEERHRAEGEGDELAEERAWKLFALVPRMLMHRVKGIASVGRDERFERRTLRQGQVAGIVGFSQEFHSHQNSEEPVFQERRGTKRFGSPRTRAEGPGFTSQTGTRRFTIGSQNRGDFAGAP